MEIISQHTDGSEAVNQTLALVITFIKHKSEKKDDKSLVSRLVKYTPSIVGNRTKFSSVAAAVFDIDDTLLFDVESTKRHPNNVMRNHIIVDLMLRLKQVGTDVHLVTARLDDPSYIEDTKKELESLGIFAEKHYSSLSLAPSKSRTSMAAVSKWKMETRKKIAKELKAPITLTVGDQWGDMIVLKHDDDIQTLNEKHKADDMPYIVLRPCDGVSLWGLKLPAFD